MNAPGPGRRKLNVSYKLNVQNIFDREDVSVARYYPVGREVAFTTTLRF